MMTSGFVCFSVVPLLFQVAQATEDGGQTFSVFLSGNGGYDMFRIPALLAVDERVLLAFAEGRKKGLGDSGDIDIVLRRSVDGGESWEPMRVVWDDSVNTCGNPCVVWDADTRTVWLLLTWNAGDDDEQRIIAGKSPTGRRVFVTYSNDLGETWSEPRDITEDVKSSGWTWYATGPGVGIELKGEKYRGRLVVPCDHANAKTRKYHAHVIYSDDHGKTWRRGKPTAEGANECQVVELTDGRLLLNCRNYNRQWKCRSITYSDDGGESWSDFRYDEVLVEPICQASLIALPDHPRTLVFSNPADTEDRLRLTVRLSDDEGNTWKNALEVHRGPAAYSCLSYMGNGRIGVLYENGVDSAYEQIAFRIVSLETLLSR